MKSLDVPPIESYHHDIGLLLAALEDSTNEWKEYLGKPSIEAITWQPVENFHSIGGLLLHMIECELYWFENFIAGKRGRKEDKELLKISEINQMGVNWPKAPAEPIEWYFDLHQKYRKRSCEHLLNENPERIIARKNYEMSVRWVIAHVVEHDSYHGGQAVLLHELYKKMGQK